jgi:glycosyltransferase involved in cell wall biosynthesis
LLLIKKEKIDLLHCQGFLSSLLGFLLSRLTGLPYLVTVQRLERRGNPLKSLVYRKAALIIAASTAVKRYFEEIGCQNIEILPNGIDLKRFKNLEPKPHQGFIVITVARLEKVKGIEYLIKAIDVLRSNNLENLTRNLVLEKKVRFLGQIPNEKIPEYLVLADCFVLPSLREGFGIAVLEAQAAGLPVIGTKVGGILDLIENGKTGLLVEPGDPQALASAIFKVYSGQRFARPNLEKYSWQNIAQKVYESYLRCRNISS